MPLDTDISELLFLGMQGLFFILLLFFAIQALFLAYHWFAYGNNKIVSMIALAIYLFGGATLLITFALSLNALLI